MLFFPPSVSLIRGTLNGRVAISVPPGHSVRCPDLADDPRRSGLTILEITVTEYEKQTLRGSRYEALSWHNKLKDLRGPSGMAFSAERL